MTRYHECILNSEITMKNRRESEMVIQENSRRRFIYLRPCRQRCIGTRAMCRAYARRRPPVDDRRLLHRGRKLRVLP